MLLKVQKSVNPKRGAECHGHPVRADVFFVPAGAESVRDDVCHTET